MATVTLTYTAPTPIPVQAGKQICSIFYPDNAACDLKCFDGTYYDKNVAGYGEGLGIEKFFADSVAHPGLIAAIRKAMADGDYSFEVDEKEALYLGECAKALKDQGITVEIA